MDKKIWWGLGAFFLLTILIVTLLLLAVENSDYRTKTLAETVNIDLKEVTEISLSYPISKDGVYRSTRDEEEIGYLTDYLASVHFERLIGDQSSYMPTQASMIYLYTEDESAFIVPYEKEAMIDYKVYRIKGGRIENEFLMEFFLLIGEQG